MLYWAVVFFVISLVTGFMGMNGIAGFTMDVAQFLFWGFLILAGVFLVLGIWGAKKTTNMLR